MNHHILKSKLLWIFLVAVCCVLSLVAYNKFTSTKLESAAGAHGFSIFWWEVQTVPLKWMHLLWEMYPGNAPTHSERYLIVQEYLQLSRKLEKESSRVENALLAKGLTEPANITKMIDEDLAELIFQKKVLRNRAEEAVEAAVSEAARQNELGLPFGILFPPTDFRLEDPPLILISSPRHKIVMEGSHLIKNDINFRDRFMIESKAESDGKTSALVDNLSGLGTYPAFVSDKYDLRYLMRTAAHEWLHNYWIFHPLGRNMWSSSDMYTLNETAANIAGNELGDQAFEFLGGDLSEYEYKYSKSETANPHLTRILRETRTEAEKILETGDVEVAEDYMEKQRWKLRLGGYSIRKINQAYFAFRGNYADGPSSINPIGPELDEFREYFDNVGSFIQTIQGVKSYEAFTSLLESKRKSKAAGKITPGH